MVKKVENGDIDSLNRSKEEIIKTKKEKGGLIASSWYLKGKTSRTITCQPTPDGELARRLNKALNKPENKERILVAEDGGRPAMACLRETDPFFKGGCRFGDTSCPVETNKDCAVQGVLYEITCNTCTEPVEAGDNNKETRQPGGQARCNYIGMTRTSVHYRMMGHLQGQKARPRKNPLWRHDLEKHQDHPQQYTTRVLQKETNLLPLCIS